VLHGLPSAFKEEALLRVHPLGFQRRDVEEQGIELDYEEVRKMVYGMPYSEWKEKYQK